MIHYVRKAGSLITIILMPHLLQLVKYWGFSDLNSCLNQLTLTKNHTENSEQYWKPWEKRLTLYWHIFIKFQCDFQCPIKNSVTTLQYGLCEKKNPCFFQDQFLPLLMNNKPVNWSTCIDYQKLVLSLVMTTVKLNKY